MKINNKRIIEIKRKATSKYNAFYGLGEGNKDVIYLLKIIENLTKHKKNRHYQKDFCDSCELLKQEEEMDKLYENPRGIGKRNELIDELKISKEGLKNVRYTLF